MQPPPNMDKKRGLDWRVGVACSKKSGCQLQPQPKPAMGLGRFIMRAPVCVAILVMVVVIPPKPTGRLMIVFRCFCAFPFLLRQPEQKQLIAEHKLYAVPDPTYGGQLQDLAIQGHEAEGKMHITYTEKKIKLAGGEQVSLRVPSYKITNWGYGKPHKDLMISPRIAPQMIGLGLVGSYSASADHGQCRPAGQG